MTKLSFLVGAGLLSLVTVVIAEEPAQKPKAEPESTKATYVLTGLHCRPCTKTVESSLQKAKGIRSIEVDWDTKQAHVEFDESVVPAQKVASLIADTPHMMGGKMHYGGLLVLKVNEIKDESTAKPVKEALVESERRGTSTGLSRSAFCRSSIRYQRRRDDEAVDRSSKGGWPISHDLTRRCRF